MFAYPPIIKPKNPAILFLHGWKGDSTSNNLRAKVLAEKGYICMTFDMPGHGNEKEAIDTVTRLDLVAAAVKAYDELASLPEVDKENISFISVSLGSYIALLLSKERNAQRIVLRAPADYPNDNFDMPLALIAGSNLRTLEWRQQPHGLESSYALNALYSFGGPVYIIESENDASVPHQTIENYIGAVKDKSKLVHVVIPNAEHSLNEEQNAQFMAMLEKWFS